MPVLERMAAIGLPLCVHGEVTDPEVDIFDREAAFIDRVLAPLRARLPELRVVMEHITTADGVDYVRGGGATIAGTITVHHLILNRNHLLVGGVRPHFYCLPIVKRERHRLALRAAATGGDAALLPRHRQRPAPARRQGGRLRLRRRLLRARWRSPGSPQVFEEEGALDRLEGFASLHGPAFYGLPPNEDADHPERPQRRAGRRCRPTRRDRRRRRCVVFDPGRPLHWRVPD